MLPRFGYSSFDRAAPDISPVERFVAGTDPGSVVQEAISANQYLDNGFFSPEQAMFGGIGALEDTTRFMREQRKAINTRAFNALNLTNAAMATRGRQAEIDARREAEDEFDQFKAETAGKSTEEVLDILQDYSHNPLARMMVRGQVEARTMGTDLKRDAVAEAGLDAQMEADALDPTARRDAIVQKRNLDKLQMQQAGTAMHSAIAAGNAKDRFGIMKSLARTNLPAEQKMAFSDFLMQDGNEEAKLLLGHVAELWKAFAVLPKGSQLFDLGEQGTRAMMEIMSRGNPSAQSWDLIGKQAQLIENYQAAKALKEKEDKEESDELKTTKAKLDIQKSQLSAVEDVLNNDATLVAQGEESALTPKDKAALESARTRLVEKIKNIEVADGGIPPKETGDKVEGYIKDVIGESE